MKRNFSSNGQSFKKIKLNKSNSVNEDVTMINPNENLSVDKTADFDSDKLLMLDNLMNHSNHFLELQVSELLDQRRLSDKVINSLKKFIISFRKFLKLNIPLSENLAKVKCPLDDANQIFNYEPPKIIKFCNSLQTVLVNKTTFINIMIEIPKICIYSKDYLNGGYFIRRAQYLQHLMAVLYSSSNYIDCKFCFEFNRHMPTILFTTAELKKYRIEFNIETGIDDVFKISRFTSNTNNVRKTIYENTFKYCIPDEEDSQVSNSYYDSCILKDMLISKHRNFYHENLKDKSRFYDAIILIKLWLSKRSINLCLLNDVVTTFIIYLLDKNRINEQMSVLEIFKIFCSHLAKSNWNKDGIFFNNLVSRNILPAEYFLKNFEIIFTDRSGVFNLCYDWTIYQYNSLCFEAKMTCDLLNSEALDKFRQLFFDETSFYMKYDYIFQINTECLENIFTQSKKLSPILMNYYGDYIKLAYIKISQILKKGLGKRILLLNFNFERHLFSPNNIPSYPFENFLTFGVLINKASAYVIEERGPVANSDEAAEFLKFWGEISEQYYHPGENVCEVVKWKCRNFLERRLIILKIVKHLLLRHFNISKKSLLFYGQQFDALLQSPVSIDVGVKESVGSGEEICDSVIRLSDSLSKVLRNIPDLPLPINSVQGISPIFRYTEILPYATASREYVKTYLIGNCAAPMVNLVPPFKPIYEIICILEGSGKWPDDREAIKRLKSAFYIKLAPSLKMFNYTIKVYPSFIDAIPSKFSTVFRIRVGFLHEINQCKKTILDDGKIMMMENEEAKKMEMRLVILPKLTSILHGLQQQHNTYGYACRLCKRWLSAQLLSRSIEPELVDLIVAYLYVGSRSQQAPCSQLSAFLQFLHLIINFDWSQQPFIVNLNNKFSQSDISDIEQFFNNNVNQSMFISYPDDKFSQIWKKPTNQILRRLIAVAQASLATIENNLINNISLIADFKKVFRPPINDFDVIISLKSELCPRYWESIDYHPIKRVDKFFFNSENLYPVINFDPVQMYISDLENKLGDFLTIFNDCHGGIIIAGVWKKKAFEPVKYEEERLEMRRFSEKKDEEGLLIPCFDKITDKIKLLGKDLIDSVTILNKFGF